ncbi:MAG: response regulator transcription factor [Fusobacteriaceae bacterium]|jgi:DNA-binding NarL/FixJ family response regulator|nr:response regulator transcription factor [Fusobacteriaceae bacterium]
MINVMIADDQELICQSLEIVIKNKADMRVVAIANNGLDTIELAKKYKPDVLLLDIRMPGINGVECIKILKEKKLDTKIIILTTFDDDEYVFEAVKNGASGYLLKGISLDELVKSIRLVAEGGTLISPDVATKVFKFFSDMAKSNYTQKVDERFLNDFNTSELKIIQLVGRGLSNKEITDELNISEGTVRNYISNILSKLDLKNRTQLAILAVQTGISVDFSSYTD